VLLFDVNETLSDMSLMGGHFASVGAPSHLAPLWFAHTLRDGLALAALGQQAEFSAIAKDTLRVLLTSPDVQGNLNRSVDAAIAHILEGFQSLPLHNDVAPAMRALKAAGFTLATLSNGSASNAEKLLSSAEVRDCFTTILSVEDAAAPRTGWKPARSTYEYAAAQLGCPLSDMLLVAVHPWDLQGGHQAGLQTAFIDRRAAAHGGIPTPFPSHFAAPTYTASSMNELYQQLTRAKKE
jgi:2-haloacid dehalogenase